MARGLLGLQEMFETSLMDTLPEELPDEAPRDLEERLTSMVSDLADSLTESTGARWFRRLPSGECTG